MVLQKQPTIESEGGTVESLPAGRHPTVALESEAAGDVPPERQTPTVSESPMKREMDVLLASLGLLASAAVWPLIAGAIKLEDGGPVFYSQHRVGKGGKLFPSYKFRSMSPRSQDPDVPGQAELEDDRITRVGRFLRAAALDELPQLWNILRGEMSFVGPRALLPAEEEANGNGDPERLHELTGFEERHAVRPGLTGLAQVYAPRDLPRRQKFRYDLLYVRTRSLRLDLSLVLKSVWISLRGKWPEVGRDDDANPAQRKETT